MKWTLVWLTLALPAQAAEMDMNTQTCQDWIDADEDDQDLMTAWLRGYVAGRASSGLFDVNAVRSASAQMKSYCQQHLSMGLLSAVGQVKR
jgi:hypothetical protein